jgi:hypothetical protein
MRRFRIAIRIALMVFLVFVFVVGWMAASIWWPASEREKREIAAGMIQFYNQPHPHGIWNEDLPASLTERDREHYRSSLNDPACDVHPDYMSIGYYYTRFGIDYERDYTIVRGPMRSMYLHSPPDDTNWALMSETRCWSSWKNDWLTLHEQPITITNSP